MVASMEGGSGCAVSGSALSGIFCDQPFQLSLTVTDCFSNSRLDLRRRKHLQRMLCSLCRLHCCLD